MDQRLPPRVQHREEPDRRTEVPRIGRNDPERLRDGPKQETIRDRLVLVRDGANLGGHGEHDMEVLGVEQVRRARFDPRGARQRLARWAVAIATRVVPDARVPTLVALLDMAAERGRPTPSIAVMTRRCAVDSVAAAWAR